MTLHLGQQLGQPDIVRGLGGKDGNLPVDVLGRHAARVVQVHGEAQLGHEGVGAVTVGLVHHEDVRHLHEPGLHGLHGIARLRHEGDHRGIRLLDDVQLRLPHSDRLDEDPREAGRVHELDDVAGSGGEAPQASARGHAADENVRIQGVRLHPDAVAQHRPASERARGIDGDDADPLALRAETRGQPVHECRLARARRSGDAEHVGPPQVRLHTAHDLRHARQAVLHPGDEAGEGQTITGEHAVDERDHADVRRERAGTTGF